MPVPVALGVTDPVLDFALQAAAGQRALDDALAGRQVVGMDQPGMALAKQVLRVHAQRLAPVARQLLEAAVEVEREHQLAGAFEVALQSLLAAEQRLLEPVTLAGSRQYRVVRLLDDGLPARLGSLPVLSQRGQTGLLAPQGQVGAPFHEPERHQCQYQHQSGRWRGGWRHDPAGPGRHRQASQADEPERQ